MTITLTREEAQQVLDALEKGAWDTLRGRNAAETLRAKLSAPEPNPVAYLLRKEFGIGYEIGGREDYGAIPVYTEHEWNGLSDKAKLFFIRYAETHSTLDLIEAICEELKAKNS